MTKEKKSDPDRATILIAAARIGCCPAVAEKILRAGTPDVARSRVHREAARRYFAEMKAEGAR